MAIYVVLCFILHTGAVMILAASLEFEKGHNSEVTERPSDNEEIPIVSTYSQQKHMVFNLQSIFTSPPIPPYLPWNVNPENPTEAFSS